MSAQRIDTDVLVVGGGPGGAAAAYYLARQGIDVTVVDKATFPREKVCGDGLTPRSVAALLRMGIDTDDARFERVKGLRVLLASHHDRAPVARAVLVAGLRPRHAARGVRLHS